MSQENILLIGIFLIGAGALIGFFCTKSEGFGKYTTSALVLLMALILSTALAASGVIDSRFFVNVLMAIVGFAGGLIQGSDRNLPNDN